MTNTNTNRYRLGLDLGTNSIGWAAVQLNENDEPCGILDMGVRIFPDGRDERSKASNAADRRTARGARRRRDRYLKRRGDLMEALINCGLMPHDEASRKTIERLDPYKLRSDALNSNKPLPDYHVGRALFHLNQRRGFQSNRKSDSSDNNAGVVKTATEALNEELKSQTLGEFLYGRHRVGDPVRFRNLSTVTGKSKYEFYPTRKMVLDEFQAIWEAQAPHHAGIMTTEAKESIRKTIFSQRPLQSQPVGKCTLDPARDDKDIEGFRCSWAHPLAQSFRIWEEVRNLEVMEAGQKSRPLRKEEGDRIAAALFQSKEVSFDKIRRLLRLPDGVRFNLESDRRKKLQGDETAAKLSHKDYFNKAWRNLPLDKQIEIVDLFLNDKVEDADVIDWLVGHTTLDREAADRAASASLPEGHCRLGLRAIRNIVPHMKDGMKYHQAAAAAGYDHAKLPTGELSPDRLLPYYGERLKDHLAGSGDPKDPADKRYGRFPNPTVHIGLNQLRYVVNALVKKHGPPHQVVIEVTRDLKRSKKQRENIAKEQAANQKKNDARNNKLAGLGERQNARNRMKLRLWEDLNPDNCLDRRCPFTGEVISLNRLFSKDDEVEIEHLIPWSVSYDDSAANKVVALTSANRQKGQRTPYEAFGDTPEWEGIVQRAEKLPTDKQWRFAPDASEQFKEQGGFLARQLNETGWLARLAKEYLTAVASPNNIWVSPGRLTDLIRGKWGLKALLPDPPPGETKNRNDHRHHAIDALVVALTDRSLLQRMSSAYDAIRKRIIATQPWPGVTVEEFRDHVQEHLDRIVVSYKPDHGTRGKKGTTGQLHNETAYGLVELSEDGPSTVVIRKKVVDFKKRSDLDTVRDPEMGNALKELWDQVESEGGKPADFAERAATNGVLMNGQRQTVRRVRVLEKQNVIPIKDTSGKPYKGYLPGGNEFADVWEMRDKRKSWRIVAVPTFYANQPDFDITKFRPHPAAKRVMRLYKNDMGALREGAKLRIVRVRKFK